MKFIFFGPSKEIELLTQGFDKSTFFVFDDGEKVIAKAKEQDCLVFINFDFNAEQAKKINDTLTPEKEIKRIVYSRTRDLKKEKILADEFIIGPLNKASFQNAFSEVMGGKTMTSFTLGPKGLDSDINKGIQDAFDDAFSEGEPEKPQAAPAATEEQNLAAPAEAPGPVTPPAETPSGGITDEESNLEFSVGGMDIPTTDEKPPEAVEAKPSGGLDLSESPAEAAETPPKAEELSGLSLDDGNEPAPAPTDAGGMGDLEIPSLGEDLPGLELGGSEDVAAAAPQDQGIDLDAAPPVTPPPPEPIKVQPKPPAELPNALSDPSMEFTAMIKGEEGIRPHDTKEFKFDVPHSKEEVKKEEVSITPPTPPSETSTVAVQSIPPSSKVGDASVVRLEAIIRALREEREALLKEIQENKDSKARLLSENLNLEATSEELRVELAIIKKKNEEEFHEGAIGKKVLKEKLTLEEEKNRRLQKDLEILAQKENIDTSKIHQKEKELEGKLELLSIDSQNQISSREKKIAELKREVDAMTFNMSNLVSREKKLRQEKLEVEEKLNKIMRTMRNSIQFLEEELDGNQKLFKELKK